MWAAVKDFGDVGFVYNKKMIKKCQQQILRLCRGLGVWLNWCSSSSCALCFLSSLSPAFSLMSHISSFPRHLFPPEAPVSEVARWLPREGFSIRWAACLPACLPAWHPLCEPRLHGLTGSLLIPPSLSVSPCTHLSNTLCLPPQQPDQSHTARLEGRETKRDRDWRGESGGLPKVCCCWSFG